MDKPAKTSVPINPVIKKRWSPRSFSPEPVAPHLLRQLMEAARWAPSSFNEQPWRFIIGQKGDETYEHILQSLVKFNRNWSHLAPVLAITIVKKTFSKNGKSNRVSTFDVGQSVAYLTFQAYDLGLVMHQMAGMDLEKAARLFAIPEDYEPLTAFALGYQGPVENLPEDLHESEISGRSRKPLHELVFSEGFGHPFFEDQKS